MKQLVVLRDRGVIAYRVLCWGGDVARKESRTEEKLGEGVMGIGFNIAENGCIQE